MLIAIEVPDFLNELGKGAAMPSVSGYNMDSVTACKVDYPDRQDGPEWLTKRRLNALMTGLFTCTRSAL